MTPLYIIPARGGSKGIPHKNIKHLNGKPLIAYTIEVVLKAQETLEGYILLSTDDPAIADTARTCGIAVEYMRPEHLGGDTVGSREVILDAMQWADAKGIAYDCVILLQPTSPLRLVDDVLGAAALYDGSADMVVSVCPADANPYYNLFELDTQGVLHISKGTGLITRRQDAPAVYEYNGAVYVIKPESIRQMALGQFPLRLPFVMPRNRSVDLDTPADWTLCEMIMKEL